MQVHSEWMMLITRPWVEARIERTRADQKRDGVEQVGHRGGHIQTVVEGQHEQVASQDGYVVPHHVLLQILGGIGAGFVHDPAHSRDDLLGHQLDVGRGQSHCRVGHDLHLRRS